MNKLFEAAFLYAVGQEAYESWRLAARRHNTANAAWQEYLGE